MLLIRTLTGIATVVAALLAVPRTSQALTCTASRDCPKGTICQESALPQKPAIACVSGDCPAIAKPVMTCELASCQTDADCGQDMICRTDTSATCTTLAMPVKCDPTATNCLPVPTPPPTCTNVKISRCAYKWEQSCNVSADCGDGFVCRPSTTTTCSGSSGTGSRGSGKGGASTGVGGAGGAVSGGFVPPPQPLPPDTGFAPAPVCTTTTSFDCHAIVTSCNVDSDCPSVWTCVEFAPTPSTGVGGSGGATGISGPSGSDTVSSGTAPPSTTGSGAEPALLPPISADPAPSAPSTKTCQRPNYASLSGVGATEGSGGTSGSTGDPVNSPALDDNAPPSAGERAPKDTVGQTSNSPAAPTANAPGSTPSPSPSTPSADSASGNAKAATTTTGGGCAIGSGPLSGDSTVLLALLGALGLMLARRNRKG